MSLRTTSSFFFISALLHGILFGLMGSISGSSVYSEFTPIEMVSSPNHVSGPRFSPAEKKITQSAISPKEVIPLKSEATSDFVDPEQSPHFEESLPTATEGSLVTQGLRPLNMDQVNRSIQRTTEAKQKNIEGFIKLKLLVDEHGQVRQVTPMNNLGFGLDEVAIAAAWKLFFVPAKVDSRNVALETYYTVKFKIDHQ